MGKIVKAGLRSRARGNLELMMQRGTSIGEISTESGARPFVPFVARLAQTSFLLSRCCLRLGSLYLGC